MKGYPEKRNGFKLWNGRGHGRKYDRGHFYVAAKSIRQAAELVAKASNGVVGVYEISEYYSPHWGTPMDGIIPDAPGVWAQETLISKPVKIL